MFHILSYFDLDWEDDLDDEIMSETPDSSKKIIGQTLATNYIAGINYLDYTKVNQR